MSVHQVHDRHCVDKAADHLGELWCPFVELIGIYLMQITWKNHHVGFQGDQSVQRLVFVTADLGGLEVSYHADSNGLADSLDRELN